FACKEESIACTLSCKKRCPRSCFCSSTNSWPDPEWQPSEGNTCNLSCQEDCSGECSSNKLASQSCFAGSAGSERRENIGEKLTRITSAYINDICPFICCDFHTFAHFKCIIHQCYTYQYRFNYLATGSPRAEFVIYNPAYCCCYACTVPRFFSKKAIAYCRRPLCTSWIVGAGLHIMLNYPITVASVIWSVIKSHINYCNRNRLFVCVPKSHIRPYSFYVECRIFQILSVSRIVIHRIAYRVFRSEIGFVIVIRASEL